MRRFFFEHTATYGGGDVITLPASESRHISRVLRLSVGDAVELLDGQGAVYSAVLTEVGTSVVAKVISLSHPGEDSLQLIVGQGLLKGKKMDTVVQKCTELGVNRFIPFASSRCQGKLDDLREGKKHDRFHRIVEAACKQCMRPDLMALDRAADYAAVVEEFSSLPVESSLKLLFWEEEQTRTLHDIEVKDNLERVVILLGPEGGLTGEEAVLAEQAGFISVSLGSRILRAETATLAAVSVVQYMTGNM
ncbi:16S rRNA (uracil(1498)-N(3))-methyltransferase [Desulfopila sp. IMCC35008]|uniref:16S rRNA (uracil(1498)-N(3))-methyltransferase n=1 Tax=Desulfopila sp. IMCC35008 TaxID=2653858 RepID=UPI0013D52F94|nr:16S rRNA (uracil(1498)-N(3))-methyltransferase [Desulfopila sp. IMCC35008]